MGKKKTIKTDSFVCDITYSKQDTEDAIKQLNLEIIKQEDWIELLEEKKSLEKRLSIVKVKIIKQCIISAYRQKKRCEDQITRLTKPSPKKAKKKEQI